jgi:hypothetical protein
MAVLTYGFFHPKNAKRVQFIGYTSLVVSTGQIVHELLALWDRKIQLVHKHAKVYFSCPALLYFEAPNRQAQAKVVKYV